jgi:HEPN domain-containing protein
MELNFNFTEKEKEYIATLLTKYKEHYSKSMFKELAHKVINPNKVVKEIDASEIKKRYLQRMFDDLNTDEFLSFLREFVKETKPNKMIESFNPESGKDEQIITQASKDHEKFITNLNKIFTSYKIIITYEGEFSSLTEPILLKGFDTYIFDLLEKYKLGDVKELLDNSYDFCKNGKYIDSVFNSGKSIEGVLKKTLISIGQYSEESEVASDLKKEIGKLMGRLEKEKFWTEKDPAYKVTDVFRDIFRNVSSHYSTEDTTLKLVRFERSEALFAYYMSLTLVSYLLERLNDLMNAKQQTKT